MVFFMTTVVKCILAYCRQCTRQHPKYITIQVLLLTLIVYMSSNIDLQRTIVKEKYTLCIYSMLFCGYERSKPVGRQYRDYIFIGVKIFYSKDKTRVMRKYVGVVVGRNTLQLTIHLSLSVQYCSPLHQISSIIMLLC